MTRRSLRHLPHLFAALLGVVLVVGGTGPVALFAQLPPPPVYVALGDSVEFGLGDDIPVADRLPDCAHPSGLGYQVIALLASQAFQ
jgi:hypothetical protein